MIVTREGNAAPRGPEFCTIVQIPERPGCHGPSPPALLPRDTSEELRDILQRDLAQEALEHAEHVAKIAAQALGGSPGRRVCQGGPFAQRTSSDP